MSSAPLLPHYRHKLGIAVLLLRQQGRAGHRGHRDPRQQLTARLEQLPTATARRDRLRALIREHITIAVREYTLNGLLLAASLYAVLFRRSRRTRTSAL